MGKELPGIANNANSETVFRYHNNVPSFFCDSDIDKFLNYNNITHKLRDTHQAMDYHPYHYYYYYYYYYTVFLCCKGDCSNGKKRSKIIISYLSKCAEKEKGWLQ